MRKSLKNRVGLTFLLLASLLLVTLPAVAQDVEELQPTIDASCRRPRIC